MDENRINNHEDVKAMHCGSFTSKVVARRHTANTEILQDERFLS